MVKHLGNAERTKETHGGYAGDVFSQNGDCPCLNTMSGGNRMPYVLVVGRVKTETGKTHQGNEVFSTSGSCPTIRAEAHGNLPMVLALNTHEDGTCRTLKSSCGRISAMNMSRQDSWGGSGVVVIRESKTPDRIR